MPRTVVYQSDGLPCCSGCGCLLLCIVVLFFANFGAAVTGIIAFVTAAVLAASALRLCGVHRYSPAYAYLLVPAFFASLNFSARLFRGEYPFQWEQLAIATLVIYLFLWFARGLGRR